MSSVQNSAEAVIGSVVTQSPPWAANVVGSDVLLVWSSVLDEN